MSFKIILTASNVITLSVFPLTLSIIGCVVNGPGEAALTDIGITGGGKGSNMLYLNGVQTEKLSNNDIISKIVHLVEKKAEEIKNRI